MSDEVLIEERDGLGLITLNRPKALNSLTADMCTAIREALKDWRNRPSIQAVVVMGAGDKAFCAGGDVVKVARSRQEGGDEWARFFHSEYLMNVAIAEFPKPYVALVDGIAMGGGVGVSLPGDFWIATEKTLFAMPETGLGLFPDVGGSFMLPRLPGEAGTWLALTGARIKREDLFALGIATHTMASADMDGVVDALAKAEITCHDDVRAVLDEMHTPPEPAPLARHLDAVDRHFDFDSMAEIMESLRDGDDWCRAQWGILTTKSPTSCKLTLAQLRRGRNLDRFRDAMVMEYRMVNRVMDGHDFFEGVRAILIDKDQKPVWKPARLADVADDTIEAFFVPLGSNRELDLSRLEG
ncbi:enoyl-CoA hydratase/isomerase family protein [Yunchengibacter salinarum]|uniref:enoyl-CoA hydratase/isomerase family protein n=1 Tax=Yunchengibacter salinarum TaxID=3133399 RepID=UPI0035B6880F